MISLTLPKNNEAEISLFGPGVGECIVIHFGEGRWFVIDSCLCPDTKEPIALNYLNSLGVDLKTDVIGILITHWHSDHIQGSYELLKACDSAKLYYPSALTSNEAMHLASLFRKDPFADTDKEIRDFSNIIKYLKLKNQPARISSVKTNHTFFDFRDNLPARMVALSPSDTSTQQAIAHLQQITPENGTDRLNNVVPISENINAVAIHFSFGEFSAVLGSDLEETGNPLTGWSAIIKDDIFTTLSLSKAEIFKVAHHGSENGNHEKIWTDLLKDKPISITTPYSSSKLPNSTRITDITNLSSNLYITTDPNGQGKVKRESMVDKKQKSIVKDRTIINKRMGHIQIRISDENGIKTERTDNSLKF